MNTNFLQTQSGLLNANRVVLIGSLNTRATGDYHIIDYQCGGKARSTRASADDVALFLEEQS